MAKIPCPNNVSFWNVDVPANLKFLGRRATGILNDGSGALAAILAPEIRAVPRGHVVKPASADRVRRHRPSREFQRLGCDLFLKEPSAQASLPTKATLHVKGRFRIESHVPSTRPPGCRARARRLRRRCAWPAPPVPASRRLGGGAVAARTAAGSKEALTRSPHGAQASLPTKAPPPVKERFESSPARRADEPGRNSEQPNGHAVPARLPCTYKGFAGARARVSPARRRALSDRASRAALAVTAALASRRTRSRGPTRGRPGGHGASARLPCPARSRCCPGSGSPPTRSPRRSA